MAEELYKLSFNYWRSGVLRAAVMLDVFSLLDNNPLSSDAVSQKLNAKNPRFIKAFLDACVALGLLDKEGDRVKNSALSDKFLVPGRLTYIGDHMRHITNYWHTWGNLDKLVVEGRAELPFENGFVDAPNFWMDYMMGQHNRAMIGSGKELLENVDLSNRRKLLDLGGGAGSYSISLCQAYPLLQAVIIDQKGPLEIARKLVDENSLTDRITIVNGDINTIELDNDYDAVLISGVILLVSDQMCRHMILKAYNALCSGGLLVIQDYMQMEDVSSDRHIINMLLDLYVLIAFSPDAALQKVSDILCWMTESGFINSKQMVGPTSHFTILTALKPSS